MDKTNRLFFPNNPFPKGHRIKTFLWSGRLEEEQGLFFDFHLETEDYNAEDDGEDAAEDLPDWQSKIVWNNYHSCRISSRQQEGILVATAAHKLDFHAHSSFVLTADTDIEPGFDPEDLAFSIYLLGHDACAGHRIEINPRGDGLFTVHWTGKIALFYAGDEAFRYGFELRTGPVSFEGIHYPQHWSQAKAQAVLVELVRQGGQFHFADLNPKSFKREYKLAWRPFV